MQYGAAVLFQQSAIWSAKVGFTMTVEACERQRQVAAVHRYKLYCYHTVLVASKCTDLQKFPKTSSGSIRNNGTSTNSSSSSSSGSRASGNSLLAAVAWIA